MLPGTRCGFGEPAASLSPPVQRCLPAFSPESAPLFLKMYATAHSAFRSQQRLTVQILRTPELAAFRFSIFSPAIFRSRLFSHTHKAFGLFFFPSVGNGHAAGFGLQLPLQGSSVRFACSRWILASRLLGHAYTTLGFLSQVKHHVAQDHFWYPVRQ